MTKSEIVTNVYERLGLSKRECADLVDLFFEIIKGKLAEGENVKVSGFGNFIIKQKRSRRGRNPQTGDPISVKEKRSTFFKTGKGLKEKVF